MAPLWLIKCGAKLWAYQMMYQRNHHFKILKIKKILDVNAMLEILINLKRIF